MVKRTDPPADLAIRVVTWAAAEPALCALRRTVFIEEQQVPEHLEWDEEDPLCVHFLAEVRRDPIATARLTAEGQLGRMAVLPEWRGQGIGKALMVEILAEARRRGHSRVTLNAQTHAEDFYAAFGFRAEGGTFDDAGIPHRHMILTFEEGGEPGDG